jgi:hypothetical protein
VSLRENVARALRDLPVGAHKLASPGVRRDLRHRLGRYYAWEVGFDFHDVPVPARGEETGPPDFVGIGVPRAGTTWWFQLITNHPNVAHMKGANFAGPIHKERHFFGRFGIEEFGPSDIKEYHQWFPHYTGKMAGEWTPDYLYHAWVPPLLAKAAPDAKLLLILRDPIERFRSGYAAAIRNGDDHIGGIVAEAIGMSLYAENVRRWLDEFPADRLLTLQYETCRRDPALHLEETYKFLDLEPTFQPPELQRERNKTVEPKLELTGDLNKRLRDIFAPDIEEIAKLLPAIDVSLWPTATRA